MKALVAFALISASALTASANQYPGFRQVANGKGIVKLTTRPDIKNNKGMSINITGKAAEVMFNKLSDDLAQGIDGAERENGRYMVMKTGKNIFCMMEMGQPGQKNDYSCSIEVTNTETGEISEPGVG